MDSYLPLSEQLRILLENVMHPEGRSYTLQEISEETGISAATLSQMRNGKNDNPQLMTLRALCQFFNVPLRYFETKSVKECWSLIAEGRTVKEAPPSPQISEITYRAIKLSPNSQKNLLTLLKWVEASERAFINGEAPPPLLEEDDDDE